MKKKTERQPRNDDFQEVSLEEFNTLLANVSKELLHIPGWELRSLPQKIEEDGKEKNLIYYFLYNYKYQTSIVEKYKINGSVFAYSYPEEDIFYIAENPIIKVNK